MAKKKTVTLQVLAEHLNLSAYTVSRALRGLPGMSEDTRLAVIEAAEKLGYRTRDQQWNRVWEGVDRLRVKPRRFLFVTRANAVRNSSMNRIMEEGLRDRLEQMGNVLQLTEIPNRPEWSETSVSRMLEQMELFYADGLFISFGLPDVWERCILRLPVPKMFINFPPIGAEADSIIWDVYDAVQQSLLHLLARGHRRILYLGDNATHRGYRLRWTAFQEIASQYRLDVSEEAHLTKRYAGKESFFEAFREKWTAFRPTALLCSIHDDLNRVLDCCERLGIRIPDECSLVCLDQTEDSRFHSIASPGILVRETGHRAADRMLWRIANLHMPYEHIRVRGKFRIGTSVNFINP